MRVNAQRCGADCVLGMQSGRRQGRLEPKVSL